MTLRSLVFLTQRADNPNRDNPRAGMWRHDTLPTNNSHYEFCSTRTKQKLRTSELSGDRYVALGNSR